MPQPVTPRKLRYYRPRQRLFHGHKSHHVALAILLALFGTVVFLVQGVRYVSLVTNAPSSFSTLSGPTPTPYYHNIALLGYGGGGHEGGALTDSIVVARIDDRAKKIFLVSIPRDTWIELPVEKGGELVGHKINAAYALGLDDSWYPNKPKEYQKDNGGGGNLAKYALGELTGEKIEHFVAVSFQSFVSAVDTLGGITITRNTAFTDPWYPVEGKEKDTCGKSEEDMKAVEATLSGYLREQEFPCRYETLSFGTGTITLDGETALKYVRSRHSETEGGDFYRSQRQREVMQALKDKALNVFAIPKLVQIAQDMLKYIDTDYEAQNIPALIELFLSKKDYTIESVALTNQNVFKEGVGPHGEYMLTPRTGPDSFVPIQEYLKDRYFGLSEASAEARFNRLLATPTPTEKPTTSQ